MREVDGWCVTPAARKGSRASAVASAVLARGTAPSQLQRKVVPEGRGFAASYSVELAFRRRGTTVRDVERDETVRVSSARELTPTFA